MKCPDCDLENQPGSDVCDCGYDFLNSTAPRRVRHQLAFPRTLRTYSKDIWCWWEKRRLAYNAALFLVGLTSWVVVFVAGSAAVKPGEDFEEPLVLIFGPFLYGVLANVAYTLGPLIDLVAYIHKPRKLLFKAGFFFSIFLTTLPALVALIALVIATLSGHTL